MFNKKAPKYRVRLRGVVLKIKARAYDTSRMVGRRC